MRTTIFRLIAVALVVGVLYQATFSMTRYSLDIGTTLLIYLTAVQGWNLLAGYAGEFSLASSAFIGTGAYATAVLSIHLGLPAPLLLVASAGAGCLLALVLSAPLLRLRGDYFTIASLAVALAVQSLVINLKSLGGASGLNMDIGGLPAGGLLFQMAIGCAAAAAVVSVLVRDSRFGLRLMAVRDDPDAAQGVGIDVFRHRVGAMVLSGGLISLAGALLAIQQITVSPDGALALNWTINILLMGTVGGLGTLLGPLVGVIVVYYGLTNQLGDKPTLGLVIEGLVLVAVVVLAPRGLWPTVATGGRRLVDLVSPSRTAAAESETHDTAGVLTDSSAH